MKRGLVVSGVTFYIEILGSLNSKLKDASNDVKLTPLSGSVWKDEAGSQRSHLLGPKLDSFERWARDEREFSNFACPGRRRNAN